MLVITKLKDRPKGVVNISEDYTLYYKKKKKNFFQNMDIVPQARDNLFKSSMSARIL